ncbi:MAG: hypothetical protein P1U85_23320 [Verrucomicrobiales bacterium]|nr:hypothetical protein [Verrucomicrobiales bacterium]
MEADLDLNSNDILNVGSINAATFYRNGVELSPSDLVEVTYDQYTYGPGATARDVDDRLRDIASFSDFAPVNDGATDNTTKWNTFKDTNSSLHIIPKGNYAMTGGTGPTTEPKVFVSSSNSVLKGRNIPYLTITPLALGVWPQNHMWVYHNTSLRNDGTTAHFQKVVNTSDGYTNPKNLRASTTINVDDTGAEVAISGEIISNNNLFTPGIASITGTSKKYGRSQVFGGAFQSIDYRIEASDTDVTSVIGAEINTVVIGDDHPTLNQGGGVRVGLDIRSKTNKLVADWDTAGGNDGVGELGMGIRVSTESKANGGELRYGIFVQESFGNIVRTAGMRVKTTGSYGIYLDGSNTVAALNIIPDSAIDYGILLQGSYNTAAIRLATNQKIAWETTGSVKQWYQQSASRMVFEASGTERVGIELDPTPSVYLNSTQVVTTQQPAIANPASSTGSNNTAIISILTALRTHGLIAT